MWALVRQLPTDSRTQTILRDQQTVELINPDSEKRFGRWSLAEYQRADLLDAIRHLEVTLARALGDDKWQYPEPSARPGPRQVIRRQSGAAVAYLKKLRGKG